MTPPRNPRQGGAKLKFIPKVFPDKCMDVVQLGSGRGRRFGISEVERSQVCKTNSLDNDNATQPSGNFHRVRARSMAATRARERLRAVANFGDIRVLTILAVLLPGIRS